MPERRPLYELDHGAPWGFDDLRAGTAAAASSVFLLGLLVLLLEP